MSRSPDLSAEVRHNLDELVAKGVRAIVSSIAASAEQLRVKHIPDEAPTGSTGELSKDWREQEIDPLTRVVYPGDEAWYAHIVARGRRGVRPRRARALQIGEMFRAHAGPARANPFDDRAIGALEGRLDELMDDALKEAGL